MSKFSPRTLITRLRSQQWMIGVMEQAIVAATSLASLALMSRQIGLEQVGIVASSLVLWMLVEALQRAIVVLPLTATCPRPEADLEAFGSFIGLNVIVTGLCALILMIVGSASAARSFCSFGKPSISSAGRFSPSPTRPASPLRHLAACCSCVFPPMPTP
jgi:hypothetical protein